MAAGVVVSLPKVPLSYSDTVAASARTEVLVRAVCTEARRELVLVVRVHDVNVHATATLDIVVVAAAPTDEQPEVDYAGTETLALVSLSGATSGSLHRSVVRAPLPGHVQIQARMKQPATSTSIAATIGIELTGKP